MTTPLLARTRCCGAAVMHCALLTTRSAARRYSIAARRPESSQPQRLPGWPALVPAAWLAAELFDHLLTLPCHAACAALLSLLQQRAALPQLLLVVPLKAASGHALRRGRDRGHGPCLAAVGSLLQQHRQCPQLPRPSFAAACAAEVACAAGG